MDALRKYLHVVVGTGLVLVMLFLFQFL